MADDDFDARIRAGDLPPLSAAGDADALSQIADRLAASMTQALAAQRAANVTVNVAVPEPQTFRRSEAHLARQIARAVTRGQRTQ
jgi:hypothetical protein